MGENNKKKTKPKTESCDNNVVGKFTVGQVVNVEKRMQPGVKKPGGVGRVTKVELNSETNEIQYCVKYVLGGSEKNIHEKSLSHVSDSRNGKRGRDTFENKNEIHTNASSTKKRRMTTKKDIKTIKPQFSPIRVAESSSKTNQKEEKQVEKIDIDLNRIGILRLSVSRIFRSMRKDVIEQNELLRLVNQDSHVLAMDRNGFSSNEFHRGLWFLDKENAIMLRTKQSLTQVFLV